MNTIYNTVSEEAARTKFCRHMDGAAAAIRADGTLDSTAFCVGTACMSWETVDKEFTGAKEEISGYCTADPGRGAK